MPDIPEYQQLRQKRLKPKEVIFGEEDILQLSRGRPHYFLSERLNPYAEENEEVRRDRYYDRVTQHSDWWDLAPRHDRIWGALEANWRWNPILENEFSFSAGRAEELAEQFSPFRIRAIINNPTAVWLALSAEQRISLYRIIHRAQTTNDILINWYSLLTEYKVNPDTFLRLATNFEKEIVIQELLDQWDEDIGQESPFDISWREATFRVPDPRVDDILPPMSSVAIQLNSPPLLRYLKGHSGWESVQHWLANDAIQALGELIEEDPELPPVGPPHIYDWFEPEVRDLWESFWREKVHTAQEVSRSFLGRVFQIPGIAGNEKLNAMNRARELASSAKAWGGVKEEDLRKLTAREIGPVYQDWEEFGQQFIPEDEEE